MNHDFTILIGPRDQVHNRGTNFAGNIVNYGLGLSYRVWDRDGFRVSPVAELVGWTVLDGKESVVFIPTFVQVKETGGDTIVNAKAGVQFSCGVYDHLYIGYGRALTADVWYRGIFRPKYQWK